MTGRRDYTKLKSKASINEPASHHLTGLIQSVATTVLSEAEITPTSPPQLNSCVLVSEHTVICQLI